MHNSTNSPDRRNGLTYAESGVDIESGNRLVKAIAPLLRATARQGADGAIGGFGGVFDLKALAYRDPLLVAANDGVGSKVKLAVEVGRHDTIGIDLVAMCVNDLVVQAAEPLFFLDYFATGRLDVEAARHVIEGVAQGCREAGAALIGGETAEMPGLYADGDYDLAGFAVGIVERGDLLPRTGDIVAGDRLIGLASSGPHSNGYSLIRRIVSMTGSELGAAAPFAADTSLGEALLRPTRIYVRSVLEALKQSSGIKALAHVTGGGFTENVPRALPGEVAAAIDLDSVPCPPVFRWLAAAGGVDRAEMLRTFNCGIGMVVVVAGEEADAVRAAFTQAGETACDIGEIVPRAADAVVYRGQLPGFGNATE